MNALLDAVWSLRARLAFEALLALCLLWAAGCEADSTPLSATPAAAPAPPAPSAATIVFLGDSLTAGFGLSESEALPALIQRRVDDERLPYRVVNAGRSGDTTAGGLARIDWYLKESLNLKALVIGLGSNDAMRGLPLETMEANLRQMIRRTRERKPAARVFLWELKTFPNLGHDYAGAYAAVFPRVARSEGAVLIPFPLEAVAAQPELNQSDGIHPNAEGSRRVAERVWEALRSSL